MRKIANLVVIFLFVLFLVPPVSFARMGVGVGTGKIELDKPLKPGGLYVLSPLTVINTGDEAGEYEVSIEYQSGQSRLSPPREWFVFTPENFYLEPGQSQVIKVQVNIPVKTVPGDYFAFLSGHPIEKVDTSGGAKIGISAAAKMYFTVAPSNIFQGIYWRAVSIVKNNAPWSYVVLVAALMSIIAALFRKYFSFNIGISRKTE